MLRKSLFALVIGASFFGCKKKGADMAPAGEADKAAPSVGYGSSAVASEKADSEDSPHRAGGAPPADPAMRRELAPKGISPGATGAAIGADGARPDDIATTPPITPPANTSGGVRAGEWDDNANYRDYVKWLKESPRNVARLDVNDRQFVV
ncbi:MAG: hypothetical protein H0V17_24295, partial [Deltaproteobacteria bacterium]|nr:hypothetical protein [Deltaproteobacteria bacterium]